MALTRSQESSTRGGIAATEEAFSRIQMCRQDVESTKANLGSAYGGGDGKKYQELLQQWDDQAEVISKNLQDVINQLNETLRAQGMVQGSQQDQIDQQYSQAQGIFDTLHG